jgi:glutathione S-transferase
MILIGQYDSPFVRRVAVTLRVYGISYEHRRWSVWGNAEQIAEYNPLRRVPTLVMDDGTLLVETFAIIDAIDELAGADPSFSRLRTTCERHRAKTGHPDCRQTECTP